jgi:hypothetical protein
VARTGVTAAYEAVRTVRWVNVILGLLLLLSLLFVGLSLPGSLFGALVGVLMVILGLNSKTTRNSFDGGWRILAKTKNN